MVRSAWSAAVATTVALLFGTGWVLTVLNVRTGDVAALLLVIPLLLLIGVAAVPLLTPHLWAAPGRRALVGDGLLAVTTAGVVAMLTVGLAADLIRTSGGGVDGFTGGIVMVAVGLGALSVCVGALFGPWRARTRMPGLIVPGALTIVFLVIALVPATSGAAMAFAIGLQVIGVYGVLARPMARRDAVRVAAWGVAALVALFTTMAALQGRLLPRPRVVIGDMAGMAVIFALMVVIMLAPVVAWRTPAEA